MKNRKKWIIPLVAVLAVAVVLTGLFVVLRMNRDPAKVYSVSMFSEYGGYYGENNMSGSISTDRIQTVYLSETQEVTKIHVAEGQELKKGDPILDFNTTLTELQLKRKDLEIQKLEQEMEKTKDEYKKLLGYSYQPTAFFAGSGEPVLVQLTAPEVQKQAHLVLLANGENESEEPTEPSSEPTEPSSEPTEPSEEPTEPSSEPTEPSEDPTEPSEDPTEPSEDPTEPSDEPTEPTDDSTEPTDDSTEPTEESTEPTEPVDEHLVEDYKLVGGTGFPDNPYLFVVADDIPLEDSFVRSLLASREEVYVVFAECEENRTDNPITGAWGMSFTRKGEGWTFSFLDANGYVGQIPEPGEQQEDPIQPDPGPFFPDDPGGGGYSPAELKKMKAEMEQKLKDLDLQIRMGKVEYTRMEREMGDGTVYADFDGVVLTVGDPETAYQNREPVVKVSGGGGYLVTTAVDELSLDKIHVGQTFTVQYYWDNYGEYEATVQSVSPYPTTNRYGGGGNPNLSYYPVTMTIPGDANLMDGAWVDINMGQMDQNDDSFYLQKAFILQENGKSYVYLRGEDQRLEKREISTGRDLWGYALEITGGLSLEDYIAFPYGKTVIEGAKTVEGTPEELYGGY